MAYQAALEQRKNVNNNLCAVMAHVMKFGENRINRSCEIFYHAGGMKTPSAAYALISCISTSNVGAWRKEANDRPESEQKYLSILASSNVSIQAVLPAIWRESNSAS